METELDTLETQVSRPDRVETGGVGPCFLSIGVAQPTREVVEFDLPEVGEGQQGGGAEVRGRWR